MPGSPGRRSWTSAPGHPVGCDPALFRLTGRTKPDLFTWPEVEGDANIHGPLSFVVPSATAGYAHMHGRWGVLPLREVMAPALALARRGLPQDWFTTLKVANAASVLRLYPESARIYLPGGLPPIAPYQGTPGFFPLGSLADTLDHLARAGLRDFYEGEVAADTRRRREGDGRRAGCGRPPPAARLRCVPALELPWHGRTVQVAGGLTAGADPGARAGGHAPAAWPAGRGLVRCPGPRPARAPMPSAWPGWATRSQRRRRAAPPT